MEFENKVVLITGAGSGMGEVTAILFAKEGANVVIVDMFEDRAQKTAEQCKQFGKKVLVIKADISKADDIENVMKKTIDTFGKLDVLVNNAAMLKSVKILDGTIMDSLDDLIRTNFRSVVHFTTLAAPHLAKTKGCIINNSSVGSVSVRSGPLFSSYCATKAAVDSFTKSSALQLGEVGVRVNAVNPGPVRTNFLDNSGIPIEWEHFAKATALGRSSHPSEVANLIVYLASEKAAGITGACYLIDNGQSIK
ncbi:uncharacterized protein LOC113503119 [Trichoplusia ni]|uniref:Uncharacterized protein LOC113502808 n=1 Tax=Trichoplusia ni TaxID=7111 RepID=A0A7E5WJ40_TRINI|nr:uncharacterized protein LOC113502808 [Trichoplusia ni]XP_026740738.1 uncharacterized protein LOC113503119 [Trichoplusia ni]